MTDVAAYTPPALAAANEPDPLAPAQFEHSQRIAKMFASSELVPPHMRGKMCLQQRQKVLLRRLRLPQTC